MRRHWQQVIEINQEPMVLITKNHYEKRRRSSSVTSERQLTTKRLIAEEKQDGKNFARHICKRQEKANEITMRLWWKRTKRIDLNTKKKKKQQQQTNKRENISTNRRSTRRGEVEDKDCLRLISHQQHLITSPSGCSRIKMLTTIIVLTTLATCYGLALSASSGGAIGRTTALVAPPAPNAAPDLIMSETEPAGNSKQSARRAGRRQEGASMPLEPIEVQQQQQQPPPPPPLQHRPPSTTGIKNITAQNGQNVLLHCIVEPSGDSSDLSVSWFRGTGELQLLTYESSTIIQDDRFVVRHGLVSDHDWALQIRNLDRSTDSGLYQCQTNSEPPQSQYYQLNVVEPQVHILGAPDMAVKLGSPINLSCIISQTSTEQPQFVFWYRDGKTINYELADRGKIVIQKSQTRPDSLASNLQIFHSKLQDSGNYTCMPSGARPVSIQVHVLEGLDKRLIMFQNDDDEYYHQQLQLAAASSSSSSSSSNSAGPASIHVVRLSRGRVYAIFVGWLILQSWLQLVLQVQTTISLMLLAIIGLLVGKVTARAEEDELTPSKAVLLRADELEAHMANRKRKRAAAAGEQQQQQQQGDTTASFEERLALAPANQSQFSSASSAAASAASSASDPLIKRANSALNLLKSLRHHNHANAESGSGSESDCAFEQAILDCSTPEAAAAAKQRRHHHHHRHFGQRRQSSLELMTAIGGQNGIAKALLMNSEERKRQPQNKEKPLDSPSAASSSSSTGYNSDNTTRTSSLLTAAAAGPTAAGCEGNQQQQQRRPHSTCTSPAGSCCSSSVAEAGESHRMGTKRKVQVGAGSQLETMLAQSRATPGRDLSFAAAAAAAVVGGDGDDDSDMIELVSQPTALRLVMDELSGGARCSPALASSPSSQITCSPIGQRQQQQLPLKKQPANCSQPASVSPLSSPSSSSSSSASATSSSSSSNEESQLESHYSLPIANNKSLHSTVGSS